MPLSAVKKMTKHRYREAYLELLRRSGAKFDERYL